MFRARDGSGEPHQLGALFGSHASRRLVHQQEDGLACKSDCKLQALQVAVGKLGAGTLCGVLHADEVEQGKSTVALNLAVHAAMESDWTVLLVEADVRRPQLCDRLGVAPLPGVAEYLAGSAALEELLVHPGFGRCILLPATLDLAGAEAMLLPVDNREFVLRRALEDLGSRYDVLLLDCSPSLGLLTINALAAADEVIVPLILYPTKPPRLPALSPLTGATSPSA